MRFLMCPPEYYGIFYEINPWMHIKTKANHAAAVEQWNNLYQTLLACGAQIDLVNPQPGWPDMTFTANAGLYYANEIILSRFKYSERQGEVPFFADWFKQNNFVITNYPLQQSPYFEGAGDALLAGNKLFAGFGLRTDKNFYATEKLIDKNNFIYCELINPYFYHLDTCFCPLTSELALWYPPAFTKESQQQMQNQIELIAVQEDEAKRFACNAVVLNKHVIVPTDTPNLIRELKKKDFITHACLMDEFIKAGGACKCLTLRID